MVLSGWLSLRVTQSIHLIAFRPFDFDSPPVRPSLDRCSSFSPSLHNNAPLFVCQSIASQQCTAVRFSVHRCSPKCTSTVKSTFSPSLFILQSICSSFRRTCVRSDMNQFVRACIGHESIRSCVGLRRPSSVSRNSTRMSERPSPRALLRISERVGFWVTWSVPSPTRLERLTHPKNFGAKSIARYVFFKKKRWIPLHKRWTRFSLPTLRRMGSPTRCRWCCVASRTLLATSSTSNPLKQIRSVVRSVVRSVRSTFKIWGPQTAVRCLYVRPTDQYFGYPIHKHPTTQPFRRPLMNALGHPTVHALFRLCKRSRARWVEVPTSALARDYSDHSTDYLILLFVRSTDCPP